MVARGSVAYDDAIIFTGDAMLVRPLTEPGLTEAEVYFPGGEEELWYPYIPLFEAQKPGKRSIKLAPNYNTVRTGSARISQVGQYYEHGW
mgnify:CR=1 FL=1